MKEETDNEFRASLIISRKEGLPADTSGNRYKALCKRTKRCWPTTPNNTLQHATRCATGPNM